MWAAGLCLVAFVLLPWDRLLPMHGELARFGAFVAALALLVWSDGRLVRVRWALALGRILRGACHRCGYDVRTIRTGRCPECGAKIYRRRG